MKSDAYERLAGVSRSAGQEHLLRFWQRLDAGGRQRLAAAIESIDWPLIPLMRDLISAPAPAAAAGIEPAPVACVAADELEKARFEGEAALASGKVAVLLVAGGQGSRLGFDGPKGAYPIGPVSDASLFRLHARKVLALERLYRAKVPLLIMTSRANDRETRDFFGEQDYFGLDPARLRFFEQGMLPAMLPDGRLALETPDRPFMAPDGHGGVLGALRRSGLLDEMSAAGIETVFYFQVDNPMVRVADPVFIGIHRLRKARMSLKVCRKRSPDEGLGVVALRGGRNLIVEYTELTEAQKSARAADGSLLFGFGSVAIHVFDLEFLAREAGTDLPLHRAFKKITVCDEKGLPRTPAGPNGFKFEKFIFDVLPRAERVAIVPFEREAEFAPVKNAAGEDSPASARRALSLYNGRRLRAAGGPDLPCTPEGVPLFNLEIDPVLEADSAGLRRRGLAIGRITGDTLLE